MNRRSSIRFLFLIALLLPVTGCGEAPPLAISFRQSLWDSGGLVLIVKNASSRHLSCRMDVTSKITRMSSRFLFSLGPHGSQEIGAIQAGWSFKSGEKVKIAVEGYSTHSFAVP